jgi:hypothetical protein
MFRARLSSGFLRDYFACQKYSRGAQKYQHRNGEATWSNANGASLCRSVYARLVEQGALEYPFVNWYGEVLEASYGKEGVRRFS